MSRGDPPEPLWAYSLAEQPRPDVIARVVEEEPVDTPAPPRPAGAPRPARASGLVMGTLAAIAVAAVAFAVRDGGEWTVADVGSYWGDVPMICETTRLEQGEKAIEWFECRAVSGGVLPPGLYESPESQWTSDLTRKDAQESRIEISRDGRVVGWAKYS